MSFHTNAIYADQKCVDEYNRLRLASGMDPLPEPNKKPPIAAIFPKKIKMIVVNESIAENKEKKVNSILSRFKLCFRKKLKNVRQFKIKRKMTKSIKQQK